MYGKGIEKINEIANDPNYFEYVILSNTPEEQVTL